MGALEPKPYLVSWNLTRRCNLLCPHCYVDSVNDLQKPEAGELNTNEARLVIDELSYLNDRLMLILSGGEPMVREDIFEIVEYAARADFIPVLGSNGTLLTYESLKDLKKAGLKGLGISVDSVTPEKHDKFRGMEGAWDLSISALESAKTVGLETQIDVTITDNNMDEIESVVELAKKLKVRAVNFFFLVCTGRAMKTQISIDNYDTALKQIADIFINEKELMVRARCAPHIYRILYERGYPVPVGTRGCMAGRSYIRIDPLGNITPCPYMDVSLGNIRDKSLSTLWQEAPELIALRKGKYKGRCGSCEYLDICGGCRARSFAENGDMLGEDSLCEYQPEGSEPVELNDSFNSTLEWEDEAKERIERVPLFMKSMIIRTIEATAKEKGIKLITSELIGEMKKKGFSHKH